MNSEKIFDAVSGIDGDLVVRAGDFTAMADRFRRERSAKRRLVAVVCCLAVVCAAAGVYFGGVMKEPPELIPSEQPSAEVMETAEVIEGATEVAVAAGVPAADEPSVTVAADSPADFAADAEVPETAPFDGLSGSAPAVSVRCDGKVYYVCGEGELSVILDCGLPGVPDETVKGEFVTLLEYDGEAYIPAPDNASTGYALYKYAPSPDNGSVYVFEDHGVYFAAILFDGEHYVGLPE